jgi:hypothetical protein
MSGNTSLLAHIGWFYLALLGRIFQRAPEVIASSTHFSCKV